MAALSEILLESLVSEYAGSVSAIERIAGRIRPESGIGSGRSRTAAEHVIEQPHGVGDVQRRSLAAVHLVAARRTGFPALLQLRSAGMAAGHLRQSLSAGWARLPALLYLCATLWAASHRICSVSSLCLIPPRITLPLGAG